MKNLLSAVLLGAAFLGLACAGKPADQARIGAVCTENGQCVNDKLTCLTQFKGGYCGAAGCTKDADCLPGSFCVSHNGTNYCFLSCVDKAECNINRTLDTESNCSANITRVDTASGTQKACIPPSA
jgi:hypothetical protein